jgi:hypothetical protein
MSSVSGGPGLGMSEARAETQPASELTNSNPATQPPTGYGNLRCGLLSAMLGLAAYYGSRALGATVLNALLIAAVVCLIRAIYSGVRDRRFDPIAWFIVLADAVTLALGLYTQSPVITLFSQHIPGVIFLVFVIGGLVVKRPITESLVTWLRPGWVQQHIAAHDWTASDARAFHRMHVRLTLAVVAAQTLHLVIGSVVILTLPIDVAKVVLGAVSLVTGIGVLGITIGGIGRFLLRHKRSHAST